MKLSSGNKFTGSTLLDERNWAGHPLGTGLVYRAMLFVVAAGKNPRVRFALRSAFLTDGRASDDFVRMPLMPGQQARGNVIPLDHLGLRIPGNVMLHLHGHPMKQASGTGAMANLCRRHRRFS